MRLGLGTRETWAHLGQKCKYLHRAFQHNPNDKCVFYPAKVLQPNPTKDDHVWTFARSLTILVDPLSNTFSRLGRRSEKRKKKKEKKNKR